MNTLPKEFETKYEVPPGHYLTLRDRILGLPNLDRYSSGTGIDTFYPGATENSFFRVREGTTYGSKSFITSKTKVGSSVVSRIEKDIELSPFMDPKDFIELLEGAGLKVCGRIEKVNYFNYYFPDAVLTTYTVKDIMGDAKPQSYFEIEIVDTSLSDAQKLSLIEEYENRLNSDYIRPHNRVNKLLYEIYKVR